MKDSTQNPPKLRKPPWLKVRAPSGENYALIKSLRTDLALATVCEEARCPNLGECWAQGTATFMVLGDTCTRACRFCNVKTGNPRGALDPAEPEKLAHAVAKMNLNYVVITMVDRDDLPDGGAAHVNHCVEAVIGASPRLKVEILIGDFRSMVDPLRLMAAGPAHVLAHNLETTEAQTRRVRDGKSGYRQSLTSLRMLKDFAPAKLTKSSLMLGLGETEDDIRKAMDDLLHAGVSILTLGQYLQPTERHLPVTEFVTPDRFQQWKEEAESRGFLFCASGPLVRSSYKAGELFTERYLRQRDQEISRGEVEV
ncbi:MAG TPA: lipoyl synthase [Planctomycetota bacterium]|nr:lipoyl synthase [Planctomycetota bacterium]